MVEQQTPAVPQPSGSAKVPDGVPTTSTKPPVDMSGSGTSAKIEPSSSVDVVSTSEDSLQHSASSFPDEDDKLVSSLEPSPAVSVRKTGSFSAEHMMKRTGPELISAMTTDSSSVGGGGVRGHDGHSIQSVSSAPLARQHIRKPSFDTSTSIAASTLTSGLNQYAINLAEKSTIDHTLGETPTLDNLRPPTLQTAPVKNVSVPLSAPVAMSDVGSVGSVPSTLESVGGCPTAPLQPTQQQGVSSASSPANLQPAGLVTNHLSSQEQNPDEARSVHAPENIPSSSGENFVCGEEVSPPQKQQEEQQQHPPSPVIVAVQPQPQSAVYYQVPSVVTLPVNSAGAVGATAAAAIPPSASAVSQTTVDVPIVHQQHVATPTHSRQPSYTSLITLSQQHVPLQTATVTAPAVHPDQVIGTVGAIPVVKIQGAGLHYVKKKKGRFNLLQEAAPSIDQSSIPNNITVPARSQSPLSAISHGASLPQPPPQHQSQPQTFDGKSAPTVKKKGRFVVTNVRNPGSIRSLQPGNGPSKTSPTENQNGGGGAEASSVGPAPPPQQPILDSASQRNNVQPGVIHHTVPQATNMSIQPFMIQPIAYGTHQPSYVSTVHSAVPMDIPYDNVQYSFQPQYYFQQSNQQNSSMIQPVVEGSVGVTLPRNVQSVPQQPPNNVPQQSQQQQQQQQPQQQQQQQQPQQQQQQQQPALSTISSSGYSQPSAIVNQHQGVPTPPQTPGSAVAPNAQPPGSALVPNLELSPNRTEYTSTSLPNVPIPKAPGTSVPVTNTATEKQQQRSVAAAKKKPQSQPGRGGKFSQGIENGGLGKLCYFLDQMKKEVTDADRSIKTLQTDMKLLVRMLDWRNFIGLLISANHLSMLPTNSGHCVFVFLVDGRSLAGQEQRAGSEE
jgi:hypothetical protein